ncbi:ATP-binding protein [Argonema galeatum]|uniref:ATP-binding protein n=1 Tax=Argonema galeatum TaxID=2942762 RepID=UPI00201147F6|nr:ATP-binding protein [Argonema galeatum]MCL1464974.1 PAS domain S-box protein [Argonema galeatum A003/A1]
MELLHESGLINAENWIERPEKVQENLNARTINLAPTYRKSEKTIPQQVRIDEVPRETIMSICQASGKQEGSKPRRSLDSTLQELTFYSQSIECNSPAQEAAKLLKANSLLPGIIITDRGKFAGMISRRRFFEQMSRPFGWDLFSKRPVLALYRFVQAEILMFPSDTSIVAAARQSLQRSPDLLYEPIIVQDEQGISKMLDIHQLLLAQSEIHDSVAEALRQAEAKYRSIFENAVDGIFQSTPDGRYLSVNTSLAHLYGYDSPQELIQSFTDIGRQLYVDPNRRAQFIATIEEYESVSKFESQIYRKDGSIIWISENARAVRDADGTLVHYEGTAEDITQCKLAEEALRESEMRSRKQAAELEQTLHALQKTQTQLIQTEKMSSLGQLVAGVAHEINNPVTCIYSNLPHANQYIEDLLNLVKLYAKHYPEPHEEIEDKAEAIDLEFLREDLPKIMSAMHQGSERIREIILSLRNFSRMDEKQMKPVDIHQGIDSTLLILHHRIKGTAGYPEIQIIKEYGKVPPVNCYLGQVNQVFMNLLSNAIDALEMGTGKNNQFPIPTIWISTEVVDDFVRIHIADNGPGMTEETHRNMFEPFFTTKPAGKGTGLGLSISCQIVEEKHGGKLECTSTPGQGTEFTIEIPIHGA